MTFIHKKKFIHKKNSFIKKIYLKRTHCWPTWPCSNFYHRVSTKSLAKQYFCHLNSLLYPLSYIRITNFLSKKYLILMSLMNALPTDWPTDQRTQPIIEMRGRIVGLLGLVSTEKWFWPSKWSIHLGIHSLNH